MISHRERSASKQAIAAALVGAALLIGSAAGSAAQDIQKLGPQVGERVPDFTLTDQRGEAHSLSSLMGDNGLMLVFYRSADW